MNPLSSDFFRFLKLTFTHQTQVGGHEVLQWIKLKCKYRYSIRKRGCKDQNEANIHKQRSIYWCAVQAVLMFLPLPLYIKSNRPFITMVELWFVERQGVVVILSYFFQPRVNNGPSTTTARPPLRRLLSCSIWLHRMLLTSPHRSGI